MIKQTGALLIGKNGTKGLLQRSGIVTALMTTVFVIIKGYSAGDVMGHLVTQQESLMPMWIAALTVLIGNPSKQ